MKQRFLIAFVLLTVPIASAQTYTIADLGSLSPTAINAWGQVVGDLGGQAFIWTQRGGQKGLGILAGGTSSGAASINDLGVVTGTADGPGTVISLDPSFPNQQCSDLVQPFVWTTRKGIQGLGTVGSFNWWGSHLCDVPFSATSINVRGQVVGNSGAVSSFQWGFLWTSAHGMTVFGGSWPPTYAVGISNTGKIVGQNTITPSAIGHATWWKNGVNLIQDGSGADLGTLGGGPDVVDYASLANGVNDLGQVVGWSTTGPISFVEESSVHAVLWSPTGEIQDLGTLPGDTSSAASGINFFGQVIGSSGNGYYYAPEFNDEPLPFEVIGRPFIWNQSSGMQDINTLIPANSGWVLSSATGINIWGQIVGSGTLNGQTHGFLLTPNNPFQLR